MATTSNRQVPPGAITVTDKQKLGVVYVYRDRFGRRAAVGYAGSATNSSFHLAFADDITAARVIASFFRDLALDEDAQRTNHNDHIFKIHDVVCCSWSDAVTQVEWYRVVRVSQCHVWLQPICGEIRPTGMKGGDSVPHIDTTSTDPARWGFTDREAQVEMYEAIGDVIRMKNGHGRKWNGAPVYASWCE